MATWHKSPYFQDGKGSKLTTTVPDGLPSPVSILSEAQTNLQEISPVPLHAGKGDEHQSTVLNPGKRKVSLTHSILMS